MTGLTLILGPAASGKTATLLDRAAAHYQSDRFRPTLVLVPTVRHSDQFRRRLVERIDVAFGLDASTIDAYAKRQLDRSTLEAQVLIEGWRREYHHIRPHSALGSRPPAPETQEIRSPLPTLRAAPSVPALT